MEQLGEFSQIFRVIGFLGILAASAYFFSKFVNNRNITKHAPEGQKGIVLSDTRSLGNKQFLVVASYDHEKFLLGISSGNIQLISKLGNRSTEKFMDSDNSNS